MISKDKRSHLINLLRGLGTRAGTGTIYVTGRLNEGEQRVIKILIKQGELSDISYLQRTEPFDISDLTRLEISIATLSNIPERDRVSRCGDLPSLNELLEQLEAVACAEQAVERGQHIKADVIHVLTLALGKSAQDIVERAEAVAPSGEEPRKFLDVCIQIAGETVGVAFVSKMMQPIMEKVQQGE